MAYIKVLKDNELIGGTDNTDVYPVTTSQAIFSQNAAGIVRMIGDRPEKLEERLAYIENQIDFLISGATITYKVEPSSIYVGKTTTVTLTVLCNVAADIIMVERSMDGGETYEAIGHVEGSNNLVVTEDLTPTELGNIIYRINATINGNPLQTNYTTLSVVDENIELWWVPDHVDDVFVDTDPVMFPVLYSNPAELEGIVYEVSNPNVVAFYNADEGTYESSSTDYNTLKIRGAGDCTISATYGRVTATYPLKVKKHNLEDSDFKWSSPSYTATIGGENTFPTLINVLNLPVTYSCEQDSDVITIDSDGNIELNNPGGATIKATFAGNETYNGKTVTYSLTVDAEEEVFNWFVTDINGVTTKITSANGRFEYNTTDMPMPIIQFRHSSGLPVENYYKSPGAFVDYMDIDEETGFVDLPNHTYSVNESSSSIVVLSATRGQGSSYKNMKLTIEVKKVKADYYFVPSGKTVQFNGTSQVVDPSILPQLNFRPGEMRLEYWCDPDKADVATVNKDTGEVTINGVGTANIYAISDVYKGVYYTLNVKAAQPAESEFKWMYSTNGGGTFTDVQSNDEIAYSLAKEDKYPVIKFVNTDGGEVNFDIQYGGSNGQHIAWGGYSKSATFTIERHSETEWYVILPIRLGNYESTITYAEYYRIRAYKVLGQYQDVYITPSNTSYIFDWEVGSVPYVDSMIKITLDGPEGVAYNIPSTMLPSIKNVDDINTPAEFKPTSSVSVTRGTYQEEEYVEVTANRVNGELKGYSVTAYRSTIGLPEEREPGRGVIAPADAVWIKVYADDEQHKPKEIKYTLQILPPATPDYYVGWTTGTPAGFNSITDLMTLNPEGRVSASQPVYEDTFGDNNIFYLMYKSSKLPQSIELISNNISQPQDIVNDNMVPPHADVTVGTETFKVFAMCFAPGYISAGDGVKITYANQ